jgi:hypothetical protein
MPRGHSTAARSHLSRARIQLAAPSMACVQLDVNIPAHQDNVPCLAHNWRGHGRSGYLRRQTNIWE